MPSDPLPLAKGNAATCCFVAFTRQRRPLPVGEDRDEGTNPQKTLLAEEPITAIYQCRQLRQQ
jgi:hypothetical protein